MRKLEARRKHERWLNPSVAQLQEEHEYMDWVLVRPEQFGDEPRNDTWEIFLAERRFAKEKERLRLRAERRKCERQERRLQAKAAKPAQVAVEPARPAVKPTRPVAEPRAPRTQGRPIDPNSKRQRRLAEKLSLLDEHRKLNAMLSAMTAAERQAWEREQYELTIRRRVQRVQHRPTSTFVKRRRQECYSALLAAVPLEQHAEAERLFTKHVELSTIAVVTEEERIRRRRSTCGASYDEKEYAETRAREARVAERVLARELSALQGREPEPQSRPWDTAGQCQGRTRLGERCRVHRSSPYAVAAPLRRGEQFCGHHHPDKYTGVRCAGIKKHGKGRCNVWSGSCYADAAPLRRGSPFCHHHRVRCAGYTKSGSRCTVTSSSEHAHATPLRRGEKFCAHHQSTCSDEGERIAPRSYDDEWELYECELCGECQAVHAPRRAATSASAFFRPSSVPVHTCAAHVDEAEEDEECDRCGQLLCECACDDSALNVWSWGSVDTCD